MRGCHLLFAWGSLLSLVLCVPNAWAVPSSCDRTPGDVSGDSALNVLDVVSMVSEILGNGDNPFFDQPSVCTDCFTDTVAATQASCPAVCTSSCCGSDTALSGGVCEATVSPVDASVCGEGTVFQSGGCVIPDPCSHAGWMDKVMAGCKELSGAKLGGFGGVGVSLPGVNLAFVDLSDADLSYADISDAVFFNANLQGADLSHTDATSANFVGADMGGANLDNADFSGAYLNDVIWDFGTSYDDTIWITEEYVCYDFPLSFCFFNQAAATCPDGYKVGSSPPPGMMATQDGCCDHASTSSSGACDLEDEE